MKNKIFPIVCIFLLIVTSLFTNVKAADLKTVSYGGVTYTLPESCSDNYIICETQGFLFLFYSDVPYWGVYKSGNDYYLYNYPDDSNYGTMNNRLNYWQYRINLNETDFSKASFHCSSIWGIVGSVSGGLDSVKIRYSTVDVHDDTGKVFFRVTPLAKIMVAEKPEKVMTEIVGVLPLILVVVVSFLGLRKALKMLLIFLNRS